MALNDVLALLIDSFDPEEIYEGQDQIDREAMEAFYSNESGYFDKEEPANVLRAFELSYMGWFGSDEGFARDFAYRDGIDIDNAAWPFDCIDWAEAANDILSGDYWTDNNGYYFRSIQ